MSEYSPQAKVLLMKWNCLSMNMGVALRRARYLQEKAETQGELGKLVLDAKLKERDVQRLYREIGLLMRAFTQEDGVIREFPEDNGQETAMPGRYVDFRISEEAIPALTARLDKLSELVLTLTLTLCFIRLK